MGRYPTRTIQRYLDLPSTLRIQTHTDIRPPHPSRPWPQTPYPLPKYTTHTTATKTKTHVQHSPCSHRIGKAQTQFFHSLPSPPTTAPSQTHAYVIHSTYTSHNIHLKHVICTRKNTLTTCTTHTRTHRKPHFPEHYTSIVVNLTLSQHTHTCNTNNSACITFTATTALTT